MKKFLNILVSFVVAILSIGAVPGMQAVSLANGINIYYINKQGNTITNASGDGVILKFERNMNNEDTYHLWFPKGVISQ